MPGAIDLRFTVGETLVGSSTVEEVLRAMDDNGVERVVLGGDERWLAHDADQGNDWLLAVVAAHPHRFSAWCTANPWNPAAARQVTRALAAGAVGVLLDPKRQGVLLLEPPLEPVLAAAAAAQVPVYVVTGVPIMSMPCQVEELSRRWPELTFVLGRSGRTDLSGDVADIVRNCPNIVLETAYNAPVVLETFLAAAGPGRLLFCSDAPNAVLPLELAKLEQVGGWPEVAERVLRQNAMDLFRFAH